MRLIFVHGSTSRSPADAWPRQVDLPNAVFTTMPGYGDESPVAFAQVAWEQRIIDACDGPACVIAHSFGGPIAMAVASRRPDLIQALVLIEPAAYALARGVPAIEGHIARMSPVLDRAADLEPGEFWSQFLAAISQRQPRPAEPSELPRAERQRLLPGPWTLSTPADVASRVPTLVLTGGWNDEYEEIARRVVGAEHRVLAGFAHRPQDHPAATELICAHAVKGGHLDR